MAVAVGYDAAGVMEKGRFSRGPGGGFEAARMMGLGRRSAEESLPYVAWGYGGIR